MTTCFSEASSGVRLMVYDDATLVGVVCSICEESWPQRLLHLEMQPPQHSLMTCHCHYSHAPYVADASTLMHRCDAWPRDWSSALYK